MKLLFFLLFLSMQLTCAFHLIHIPFEKGSSFSGTKEAPNIISRVAQRYNVKNDTIVECKGNVKSILSVAYDTCHEVLQTALKTQTLVITLGGDHTVSVSSIAAAHQICQLNGERLGVIWCDAHADFNTDATSPTGNIHGMPVSILCGHTMNALFPGEEVLKPEQFIYFGVRDLDSLEFGRFQQYNMRTMETSSNLLSWMSQFDKIHISIDVDCFDPSIAPCVSTPCANGNSFEELLYMIKILKKSKKMISMDIVELNISKGNPTKFIKFLHTLFSLL